MRKQTTFILLFLAFAHAGIFAQDHTPAIRAQAQKVIDALANGNYQYMVDKTHPDIVSMIGGKEKMLGTLQKQMDLFLRQGVVFKSIEIGMPSEIVPADDELHCLVPQKIVLKVEGGELVSKGYLLGISQDGGSNWYFLDTAQLNNENVERMIPNYNPQLKIPEKMLPEFIQQ